MSMSSEATMLHQQYENANGIIRLGVDRAYTAARKELVDLGFDVSNTDPAEELVAAIYKYLIDSAGE